MRLSIANNPLRRTGASIVFAAIALAACGDDNLNSQRTTDDEQVEAPSAVGGTDDGAVVAAGEAVDASQTALDQQPQKAALPTVVFDTSRKLIIAMTVGIEVADAASAVDKVIFLAARYGGQLYDSQLDLTDPKTARGDLVFKMPPAEVQSFLAGLDPGIGRRTGLDGTTSDVTTQIADLGAQILAAEASVDRVRTLLESAKTLDEVIRLEIEFTSRQTRLEQLRAQQNTLDELVALATITVRLTTAPLSDVTVNAIGDLPRTMDDKGVDAAFSRGWKAFTAVLVAIALFVGYTAPFLVLAAVAAFGLLRIGRRIRRRNARQNSSANVDSVADDLGDLPTPVG